MFWRAPRCWHHHEGKIAAEREPLGPQSPGSEGCRVAGVLGPSARGAWGASPFQGGRESVGWLSVRGAEDLEPVVEARTGDGCPVHRAPLFPETRGNNCMRASVPKGEAEKAGHVTRPEKLNGIGVLSIGYADVSKPHGWCSPRWEFSADLVGEPRTES